MRPQSTLRQRAKAKERLSPQDEQTGRPCAPERVSFAQTIRKVLATRSSAQPMRISTIPMPNANAATPKLTTEV